MKVHRKFILTGLITVGLLLASVAAYSADVTGTWKMTVQTQAGAGEATFALAQNGEAITGTYQGALGEAPVTGTLKEGKITLNYAASRMGMEIKVQYTGTVDGDTMTGKVDMAGRGGGSFTGKKQAETK